MSPARRAPAAGFEVAGLALVTAVAAWARLAVWPQVLVAGELMPQGGDAAYHLHRTLRTAADFPRVPIHDPLMAWPDGGPCHWAPGHDLLSALPVVLLGAARDPDRGAVIASFLPLVAGVALVVLAVALARRLLPDDPLGRGCALAAGLLLAAHPQATALSRFGATDHHVFEALGMAGLGLWALVLASPAHRAAGPGRRLAVEAVGALVAAGALWTFAGAFLYVAIAAVGLGLARLVHDPGGRGTPLVGSGAPGLALAAVLLAASFGPAAAEHGRALSYVFPSWAQPILLGAAAAGCALLALVLRLSPGRGAPVVARRAALLLVGAAAGLGLAHVIAPGLTAQLRAGALDFVGAQDPWLATIEEFRPLLSGPWWRPSSWADAYDKGALVGALSPLLLPLALVLLARRGAPERWLHFATWTVAVAALALLQSRFGRVAAVNLVACAAILLDALLRALPWRRVPRAAWPLLVALGVVVCTPRSRDFLRLAPPRGPSAQEQAALFLDLRDRGPRPGQADGVLTPWDWGHPFIWLAGRPVVATGFGTFLDAASFYEVEAAWQGSAADLDALMVRRDLGFVVAGAATMAGRIGVEGAPLPFRRLPDGRGVVDPTWLRGLPAGALVVGGGGLPDGTAAHLPHLRPVQASTDTVGGLDAALPVLFTYQRVAGARLSGQAGPGDLVRLQVALDLRGQPWPWTATTRADAQGRWTLTIPLATGVRGGGITTGPLARLWPGDAAPRDLPIPLDAVLQGGPVPVE